MALWGNKDNKHSGGTVTVNYANLTVTGSGTTFGQVGAAATGDIIRFGSAFAGATDGLGGANRFEGDAVITAIGGTQSLEIHSASGLSGGAIVNHNFQISESPKSHPADAARSRKGHSATNRGASIFVNDVNAVVAAGSTIVYVSGNPTGSGVTTGNIVQAQVGQHGHPRTQVVGRVFSAGTTSITIDAAIPETDFVFKIADNVGHAIGESVLTVFPANHRLGHAHVREIRVNDTFVAGTNSIAIGTVTQHQLLDRAVITLKSGLTAAILADLFGARVTIRQGLFTGTGITVVGLETTRTTQTQVVGVSTTGQQASVGTAFETGVGWVGVTTYVDQHGSLRIKKEVLCSLSGIQTGNTPIYDANPTG